MTLIEQGKVQSGQIILARPLSLPEETVVTVRIELSAEESEGEPVADDANFFALPFFGMWADRQEMSDSEAWVRNERAKWLERLSRQD